MRRTNSEYGTVARVPLLNCRVSLADVNGIEHTVEVTAGAFTKR